MPAQKFTHIRGYAIGGPERPTWPTPDKPDITFYKTLDDRIAQMNRKGIVADLILGHDKDHLRKALSVCSAA